MSNGRIQQEGFPKTKSRRASGGPAARQSMMFAPSFPAVQEPLEERKGVIYTKKWVVDLILDLAGYRSERNLVDSFAIEPAAGEGAFLVRMAERLIKSCMKQERPLSDCMNSLLAYELDRRSAESAHCKVVMALKKIDVPAAIAVELVTSWIRTGDYLFESFNLPSADFVIGNPPYVRLEDIPEEAAGLYRKSFPAMRGRADIYVAFYEAGLRALKENGICAFICADRWMLNQYGAELRSLITSSFSINVVIEMHNAEAFEHDVSAYPAISLIGKARQGHTVIARAESGAELAGTAAMVESIESALVGKDKPTPGLSVAIVKSWFKGSDPWPCSSPAKIVLLRRLEENFGPLETPDGRTKVGIGVATGLDRVFITKEQNLVEPSRMVPLAMARDTATGYLTWSGHYLIDPWDSAGLVDLGGYPLLRAYFEKHKKLVQKRNTAERNPGGWYRTIDRVTHALTTTPKLYIPDIKNQFNPVLDLGETYPHHNLYFIISEAWDLEVLGGILLSSVGQFFVESYGVRMRGGYLRFQAQYLRRIRVPAPDAITDRQRQELQKAFRERDRTLATQIALEVYGIDPSVMEKTLEY